MGYDSKSYEQLENGSTPGFKQYWYECDSGRIEFKDAKSMMNFVTEYDTLRARVDELESVRDLITKQSNKAMRERDQLRAELEVLRPKPVVAVVYAYADDEGCVNGDLEPQPYHNIKLTFHDGALVSAEVIKETEK